MGVGEDKISLSRFFSPVKKYFPRYANNIYANVVPADGYSLCPWRTAREGLFWANLNLKTPMLIFPLAFPDFPSLRKLTKGETKRIGGYRAAGDGEGSTP